MVGIGTELMVASAIPLVFDQIKKLGKRLATAFFDKNEVEKAALVETTVEELGELLNRMELEHRKDLLELSEKVSKLENELKEQKTILTKLSRYVFYLLGLVTALSIVVIVYFIRN